VSAVAILMTEAELEALVDRRIALAQSAASKPGEPETLSLKEAAALLGVHRHTVPNLIRDKGLPCIPIGKRRMKFQRSALLLWMAERQKAKEL
jgi:excisionase family DNA binding protein